MNRAEMTRRVLLLEAAARQCAKQAKALKEEMGKAALKEFNDEGTRPVWELRDIGTWSLPLSHEAVFVADEAALLAWAKSDPVRAKEVVETVERLRPWFVVGLLRDTRVIDGQPVDNEGTVIPGLAVKPGNVPGTLSFTAASDAKAVADQVADKLVADLTAGLGISDA